MSRGLCSLSLSHSPCKFRIHRLQTDLWTWVQCWQILKRIIVILYRMKRIRIKWRYLNIKNVRVYNNVGVLLLILSRDNETKWKILHQYSCEQKRLANIFKHVGSPKIYATFFVRILYEAPHTEVLGYCHLSLLLSLIWNGVAAFLILTRFSLLPLQWATFLRVYLLSAYSYAIKVFVIKRKQNKLTHVIDFLLITLITGCWKSVQCVEVLNILEHTPYTSVLRTWGFLFDCTHIYFICFYRLCCWQKEVTLNCWCYFLFVLFFVLILCCGIFVVITYIQYFSWLMKATKHIGVGATPLDEWNRMRLYCGKGHTHRSPNKQNILFT